MRIGFDLDGIIFDFAGEFLGHLNRSIGTNLTREDIKSYYWIEKDIFDRELVSFTNQKGFRNLPTIEETMSVVNKCHANGHSLFYITKRPRNAEQCTKISLVKNRLPQSHNLFVVDRYKSGIVNSLNLDIIIDDSPEVLLELAENTKATIYCLDYPYNAYLKHENINRIYDIREFLNARGLCNV